VDFITNPLDDDVTGCVVVCFRGLQNHTVNTKSTPRDVIMERIQDKIHSLLKSGFRIGDSASALYPGKKRTKSVGNS